MVDDNAINPLTGETIYVGILEKLPEDFRWIHDLHTDDWLKIVRGLTSRASDVANATAHEHNFENGLHCSVCGVSQF